MAGLAVWAMTVPQVLAYANIAGVPPVYGLYTVPLAMAAYAIFGTSRTLSVGPESAIAIISAVTVSGIIVQGSNEYLALTSLLALIVGVVFLILGLLRMGWVAKFLSQPVLQGFVQGIALIVIISQVPSILGTGSVFSGMVGGLRNVPELIGLEFTYNGFFMQTWAVLRTLGHTHLYTTIIGLGSLVLLFTVRHYKPQIPTALIAVLLSVLFVFIFGLAERGVSVIGEIEKGMVSPTLPAVTLKKIAPLLPGAFAIVLIGYSVSLGVASVGVKQTKERIDANQELIGLGVANLGAGLSSGFVVSGSLSRGSMILKTGGKTQVVSFINAILVVLTLLFALPLFSRLPQATLSAIVIQAMSGLLNFAYFKRLLRIDKAEFAYAMAALFGVLVLGIMQGVALGVVLSIVVLIKRVSRPATAVLGKLPGTENYRDINIHKEAETFPGLLIFRFDAPVIFINASFFASRVRHLIDEAPILIREVVVEAQQINQLDSTGADALEKLKDELDVKDIVFSFAEVKSGVKEAMRRTGLENIIGADNFYKSLEEGVQIFLQRNK
jgi:high affinity sulfate transporter 1